MFSHIQSTTDSDKMWQDLQRSQAELLRNQPTTFVPHFPSSQILHTMNLQLSVSASSPLRHGHKRASTKFHGWNRLEVEIIENSTHNGSPLELAGILVLTYLHMCLQNSISRISSASTSLASALIQILSLVCCCPCSPNLSPFSSDQVSTTCWPFFFHNN